MPAVLRSLLPRRVRRLCVLAATAALLAAVSLPAPSHASVEWVLQQVQLLHRHGSRSSVPSYNTSEICGATPCGYLNVQGEAMMVNIGSFLRERYNSDATVVDEPFLPSPDYSLSVVQSRSTDVLRTLQSADRLLDGMFPNVTRLIPAIHTVVASTDLLLRSDAQPWVELYQSYATDAIRARMNPVVDAIFPDWTELTQLGALVFSEGYCAVYKKRYDCAKRLYDIAAAWRSVGQLPAAVEARYEDLHNISASYYRYQWYYNASDPFCVQQGGRGQPFLQQVLANINGFVAGTNTYKVMHYSAHDTTIAPVWGTLGDSSAYAMQPPYSQTLVLELLKQATTGEYGVRVLRGWPGQTPDTNFTFSWDPTWQLQCRDSTGTNYAATGNLCPLADFQRYVQSTVATDPRGMCLLDTETAAVLNCPTAAAEQAGAVTLSDSCAFYRAKCPAYSCAAGYVLSAAGLDCVCASAACLGTGDGSGTGGANSSGGTVAVTVRMSGVSGGAAAGIAIATFCVGALLAVAVTLVIVLVLLRRRGGGLSASRKSPAEGLVRQDSA